MPSRIDLGLEAGGNTWFLVAGAPRSGTTMLGRLLNSHPRIGCFHEVALPGFIARLRPLFLEYADRREQRDPVGTTVTWQESREAALGQTEVLALAGIGTSQIADELYKVRRNDELDAQSPYWPAVLAAEAHGAKAARALFEVAFGKAGLTHFGSKCPNADLVTEAAALARDLPRLRAIQILRRPVDVVNSSLGRRNKARLNLDAWHIRTVEDACAEWLTNWNSAQAARAVLGERLLCVKYEDLVAGRGATAAIARHLGLEDRFNAAICREAPETLSRYAMTAEEVRTTEAMLGELTAAWQRPLPELLETFPRLGIPLPLGEPLRFGEAATCQRFARSGFSGPEPDGIWTDGEQASLEFRFPANAEALALTLEFDLWRPVTGDRPFPLVITLGSRRELLTIRPEQVGADGRCRHTLLLERAALGGAGLATLELHILDPKRPMDPPVEDQRRLGLRLRRVDARAV
jgi:hypothetical protein